MRLNRRDIQPASWLVWLFFYALPGRFERRTTYATNRVRTLPIYSGGASSGRCAALHTGMAFTRYTHARLFTRRGTRGNTGPIAQNIALPTASAAISRAGARRRCVSSANNSWLPRQRHRRGRNGRRTSWRGKTHLYMRIRPFAQIVPYGHSLPIYAHRA